MSDKRSENNLSGASYVIDFYQHLEALTTNVGTYINYISRLESKYSELDLKTDEELSLEPQEWEAVNNLVQEIKNQIFKCWIKLNSLASEVSSLKEFVERKDKKDSELKIKYEAIKREFVPKRDDLEAFVLEMNRVFVKGVMSDILIKARDISEGFS